MEAHQRPKLERYGETVRMDEAHHYDLEAGDGEVSVIARIGPLRQAVARRPGPPGPLTLTVTVRTADIGPSPEFAGIEPTGPDTIAFWLGGPDAPGAEPVAELEGRYLSTEVATGFTGRVIGMYATDGTVAFDRFHYEPAPSA